VRYYVLFVIDLKSRRVEIAGIAHQPYDAWMCNVGKGLLDQVDGFLMHTRYLIHDRDPLCSRTFRNALALGGVQSVEPQVITGSPVLRRKRLGGMLSYYYREAASRRSGSGPLRADLSRPIRPRHRS